MVDGLSFPKGLVLPGKWYTMFSRKAVRNRFMIWTGGSNFTTKKLVTNIFDFASRGDYSKSCISHQDDQNVILYPDQLNIVHPWGSGSKLRMDPDAF